MADKIENRDGTIRSLSNRHVQMIAIGGTIGTGLFLGAGTTISATGPSVVFIYAIMGIFFFFLLRALGEMFYYDYNNHTFVSFISRYLATLPAGPTGSACFFPAWLSFRQSAPMSSSGCLTFQPS